VQCPNGYCGKSIEKCAGISNCPTERPFICYNGACVSSFADCELHPRSVKAPTIMISVSDAQDLEADIIFNTTGSVFGKLYIPSGVKANYTYEIDRQLYEEE